ncbi:MAG: Abi family protein [Exiguobacterium acetylicum]
MPIKPYKEIEEMYNLLVQRGLTIPDKDFFENYILNNNYFNVINGNEDLLVVSPNIRGKQYDTASFDDFVRLHKFDKILTNHLTAILHDFETRLKTSIAKNFARYYCRTPEDTMQYTNKSNFRDLKNIFGSSYTLYNDQNKKIVDGFNEFICFKGGFTYNLVRQNDFIDGNFYSIDNSLYSPPLGCNSFQNENGEEVVVPLWVAIETFDFGTLQRFCHYLNPPVLNKVLSDFNLTPGESELFLNSLDVIRELRNKCAHFSLINRFSTSLSVKILPSLINKLSLTPYEKARSVYILGQKNRVRKKAAKLSLFDTLKVLAMYENLSRLKKPLKNVMYQNNKHFIRKNYDLNTRLLERMGNIDYMEWKKLFS